MKTESLHVLISGMKSQGVIFVSNGVDSLRLRAPVGVVSAQLKTYIGDRKHEVIACLAKEAVIREWLSKISGEFSYPLDLPPEFSGRLEDAIVSFIDGLIPFEKVEAAWSCFVEESKAEREFVEDEL